MAEDDDFDGGFAPGEGRPRAAALLIDWGGVLTSDLFASFNAFCAAEGLQLRRVADAFRHDSGARELLVGIEEGRLAEAEFEARLGEILGVEPEDLIGRMFAGAVLDEEMAAAVRAARANGIRTCLVSNSWGTDRYPAPLLEELFDAVVLSGELGVRKPAPEIYATACERTGVEPGRCVFVDDLDFNLVPAREMGMLAIHHEGAPSTIAQLETALGVALRPPHPRQPVSR